MVSLSLRNENLTEPIRPFRERSLLSDNIGFHWSNERCRAYASQALRRRREAGRLARIRNIVNLIGSVIVIVIVIALCLWA